MYDLPKHNLNENWSILEKSIKLNDVCKFDGQEFICSRIVPYKSEEYIYCGDLNNNKLFILQIVVDGRFYVRVLKRRNELGFALDIFKKWSAKS